MPVNREPTPELLVPAPSGKYANFSAYIDHAVELVGSNFNLGKLMGFTSGTRVSDWRAARGGRPSVESCLRLAKLTGDDPHDILAMGGWQEVSELLREMFETGGKAGLSEADVMQPLEDLDRIMFRLKHARAAFEQALAKRS